MITKHFILTNPITRRLLQYKQVLLYCVIGGCGTALTCLTYALLVRFAGLHYQAANAIGYAGGTGLSFLLNSRYNFRVRDQQLRRFATFFAVALSGFAASAGLLRVLIGHYGLRIYSTYFVVIPVVVLLQYNLNRLLTFRKAN